MVDCCCCCIPIRLGTIILAAIVMVGAAVNAFFIFSEKEGWKSVDNGLRIVFGVSYVLIGAVSLFGLIGAVSSNRHAVRIFSSTLWFIVIIVLVINIVTLVEMFVHKQDRVDECVGNATNKTREYSQNAAKDATGDSKFLEGAANGTVDSLTKEVEEHSPDWCEKAETIKAWAHVVGYLVLTLLMAYFAGITSRFARQLESEYRRKKLHNHYGSRASTSRVSVATVSDLEYHPREK